MSIWKESLMAKWTFHKRIHKKQLKDDFKWVVFNKFVYYSINISVSLIFNL